MNTISPLVFHSSSAAETERLGEHIGTRLRGNEVVELTSDLGGGKTTFTKGLARGAGSTDSVSSPTFTISKVYKAPKFEIQHFDFYRLGEAGIVGDELLEAIEDDHIVTLIEWSDIVHDVLPKKRITIHFERVASDENDRIITIHAPSELFYLLNGLKQE